jgi:hypothetical protein
MDLKKGSEKRQKARWIIGLLCGFGCLLGIGLVELTTLPKLPVVADTSPRMNTLPQPALLSPGRHWTAQPGEIVTLTHLLTNTSPYTNIFSMDAASTHQWPVSMTLMSKEGTLQLPLHLDTGETITVCVNLSVPTKMLSGTLNIISGTVDTVVLTATSLFSPTLFDVVTDTVKVVDTQRHVVFLPLVIHHEPPTAKLSVDFSLIISDTEVLEHDVPLAQEMGASWVRIYLPWEEIEPRPGEYHWETYDAIIDRLITLELEPLALVYGPPAWAAPENCGPISDTIAFEGFLDVLLTRYGADIDAWEFINEPDGRYPHPWGATAGCWGFHPQAYAEQLKIFYKNIKAVSSSDLVVFGGLAYDDWGSGNVARDFFTQTLTYGAAPYFDVANFHYYPINLEEFPTMAHKVREIRRIMENYGVFNKRIWITETGMWVNEIGYEPLDGSLEKQLNFIVREQTRGFGVGVDNIFWFGLREQPTHEGVVHRWLISMDHQPINGYTTYQHFARTINDLQCRGRYEGVPEEVEAYLFQGNGRSVYVLWSNSGEQTVTLPMASNAILNDRDGITSTILLEQQGYVTFELDNHPVFVKSQ